MSDILAALPPITTENIDPRAVVDPSKYKSVTAEILYVHEDRPLLIDSIVWNTVDMWPTYPRLYEFRDGWLASGGADENAWGQRIEGKLLGIRAHVAPLRGVVDICYSSLLYTIPRERFILGTHDARKSREVRATGKTWSPIGYVFRN